MSRLAKVNIYGNKSRNKISRYLFGHFMEHCKDVIYGSVYDPESPLADEDGFRKDVIEVLREVGVPMLRYPGGNFVSNYHWEDGIGDKEKRPRTFDYAWLAEDNNSMGTIEFLKLCKKVGAEPYLCVNMGSGTAEEAMHWVEFCNGDKGEYANKRKALGYEKPFGVKYWGLGNEMYGDWQYGASNAIDYAKKALDFAKAMKWVDPSIELIVCGYDLGSDWNYEVARLLKPLISHIAIHHYSIGYGVFREEDYEQCMYIPDYLTKLTEVARASIIAGTNDALSEIKVAWDEWNTYAWNFEEDGDRKATLKNALLTAGILHSFIKSSNVVEIASYSPFVNVCGAISVKEDKVLKRAQYDIFKWMSKKFSVCNNYLESDLESDGYKLEEVIDYSNRLPEAKFALDAKESKRVVETKFIDVVASINEAKDKIVLSFLNKDAKKECLVDINIWGIHVNWNRTKCYRLYHPDFEASNTVKEPDKVRVEEIDTRIKDGKILLKEHSWTILEVDVEK